MVEEMKMPWESILGGATGGIAVAIIIATFFLKSLVEKVVEGAGKRFDSALRRAEAVQSNMLATASTIDTDLRSHRIEVYTELWEKTGQLPKWPRNAELTYPELTELTCALCRWYFDRGGMYLSERAREAYFGVQESLDSVLSPGKEGKVTPEDYENVRKKCSRLRSALTEDLLSRREAPQISETKTS